MKIGIEVPDEWAEQLDELARKDGHSNRSAVIRKICNIFFTEKSHFVALDENKKDEKEEKK